MSFLRNIIVFFLSFLLLVFLITLILSSHFSQYYVFSKRSNSSFSIFSLKTFDISSTSMRKRRGMHNIKQCYKSLSKLISAHLSDDLNTLPSLHFPEDARLSHAFLCYCLHWGMPFWLCTAGWILLTHPVTLHSSVSSY